ncbi:MAG: protein kinase, partial [Ktedonobacteraceae bacterium]|nr:protein kinase [Ktedonobacteraceae bacterium]
MVSHSHLYCLQCGAGNLPHAKFCVACGHSLQLDSSMPLPAMPASPKASFTPSATPQSSFAQYPLLKERYRILAPIGTGGFAEVYKAADNQFGGRLVAIKAMGIEGLNAREVNEATEAFEREAFMLANLVHPNLPAIYDYFHENQHWYLVMSFIEGMTLEDYLQARGGRLPVEKVLPIGIQLCTVLGYLHKRQPPIIFRDLKLTNVMRTPERQIYLIDFGVARLFKHGQARDTMALGSPGYAAPEQYGKAQTTPQADIYSLGATLHTLLSGVDPSEAPFHFAPLHIPAYPDLNTLIMRMVERDARKRPASISVVKQELQRIALGHSSEWAQQNWQKNVLHYATQSKAPSSPSSPSVSPGLQPLQIQHINQKKPPQNVLNSVQHIAQPISFLPQPPAPQFMAGGQQQAFYRPVPPRQPSSHPPLSRRAMVVSGVGGLFVAGGLLNYFLSRPAEPSVIVTSPAQTAAQSIPPAPAQVQNPAALFAVAWSPDGRRIIAGSGSGTVNVMDSRGQLINTYNGHNATITGLAWSPDSRRVASGSYDTTVQLWNPDTDKTLATYQQDVGSVNAISWSPNGNYIVSTDYTHNVLVWNAGSLQTVQTYSNHKDQVRSVAWSPNSRYIASGSADYSVQVWGALTGNTVFNYQGHKGAVGSVSWSPDGRRIASASDDYTVHVWDALSGDHMYVYARHIAPVTVVAWSPDGRYIASGSQDGTVQVWSALDARAIYVYRGHANGVLSLDWSSTGSIVSTDGDGKLLIW